MIATSRQAPANRLKSLTKAGIETLLIDEGAQGKLHLPDLFMQLGQRGVTSVLVEGGAAVITSILREGLADRIAVVIAPKLVGSGRDAVGDLGITLMDQALNLHSCRWRRLGPDILLTGEIAGGRIASPGEGSTALKT